MLALYRCGRQADALEAYRHARQTLVDEIGVEPSPELRRLHDAILRQDPSLDVELTADELPREVDPSAAPPLIGREDELRRLRARWRRAASGAGSLVTTVGAYGMGKTRIAAEIAGETHREGATVLYAAGTGLPEAALAAIARARDSRRPALLVLDDADRAPAEVRAALADVAPHALVLATGQEAAALTRLDPSESLVLEPLDRESVRAIAGFYAPSGDREVPVDTLLATSRGVPRRAHEAASEWARHEATRRVDAAAGRAATGRSEARALVDELAGSAGSDGRIAQPRRADPGRRLGAGRRDRRHRHAPSPDDARTARDDARPRAVHARREVARGRQHGGLGARVVDRELAADLARARRAHGRGVWASSSPDSRTLATGSPDGTISPFDLRTQQSLGTPLTAVSNRFASPLFTPDGAYLFGVTDAGRGFRWDVRPSAWSRRACVVAGRRLTRDEWHDALPGRDYDPAC